MSEVLVLGDLTFDLSFSPRRRTIGITLERDGHLTITAPAHTGREAIEAVALRKRGWVYKKLAQRGLLAQPMGKEYVSGEGFAYLGRTYRLLPVAPETGPITPPLRLQHGRFLLRRDAVARARQHFIAWYTDHARPWLERRASLLAGRIGVAPAAVEVRDLGYRWGSCNVTGSLNFHWRVALLPPSIAEYIVAHELVHLRAPHHDQEFWSRVRRVMPDYDRRKIWLAEQGGRYDL